MRIANSINKHTVIHEYSNETPRQHTPPMVVRRNKSIPLFTFIFGSTSNANQSIEYGNTRIVFKN